MNNITLADFRSGNVDAVEWRSARDGDVIMYLEPAARESYGAYAYVIDGVPHHERGSIIAWTKRIDEHAIPHMRSTAIKREFACTVFQVWRSFEVAS